MKELSTEEKAKRYDEAIKRAKKAYNSAKLNKENGVTDKITEYTIQLAETIFPELKVSDDERIRKELINFVKSRLTGFPQCEKYIAWLEKQGKQNPAEWHIEDEQNLNACLGYIPDELLRRWLKDVIHIKYDKPIDKVESKFHEGDFIKHNKANCICKIISVNSGSYCVENIETSCRIELFYAEQYFHLWTIEDARDGDVLVIESGRPFIFKGCLDERHPNSPVAYCGIDCGDDFHVSVDISWWTDGNVFPATKEQRDFLFQEMKDEGYEWDAEKKELKKIEQTIEIPFGAKDSELQEATYHIPEGYHAEINDNVVIIKKGEQKKLLE